MLSRRPHAAQEMDHLIRRVQKAEKKHGGKNLFELETQAHLTNAKMMEKKEELTVVTKSREGTQSAFEERYKFWQRSCKHKGKQANLDFNRRLTRKGHAGELRFDHRTQTLSLQVRRHLPFRSFPPHALCLRANSTPFTRLRSHGGPQREGREDVYHAAHDNMCNSARGCHTLLSPGQPQ